MIRKLKKSDIDEVSRIWLDINILTHNFIDSSYWKSNFYGVKKLLEEAECYVFVNDMNEVLGFIGLDNEYIQGIFVCKSFQSNGIGKKLLDFVKENKSNLTLNVYQKNIRAIRFYERENFKIIKEDFDDNTCEKEYFMKWER